MKAAKFGLFLLVASLAGCKTTSVVVNDSSGAAVAGAEVFLEGKPQGSTNAAGQFVGFNELSSGNQLFARRLVYEHPSYRPDHGPGSGWVMRVYQTSRIVNNDGSVTDLTVADPTATQTLTVSPNNALIGWHLVVSLDWDASEDEFDKLRTRFKEASNYLYNLTDGQFFIEQVDIADDAQLWGSAEIAFQVDTWVWPHTTYPGGFLARAGATGAHIYMSPFSEVDSGSTKPTTIVHELGHLAMGLADEYVGFNAFAQNYCTEARLNGPLGDFKSGGRRAACAMDKPSKSSKLCSAHPDSAHRGGTLQPGPCWNTVAAGYADPGPGSQFGVGVIFRDRWIIRTPDMRGAVVGTLPDLPEGLRPKFNKSNKTYPNLCQPFTFVDQASGAGATVWVRPSFWGRDFTVGKLDKNSTLIVHGAHLGDMIVTPRIIMMVDITMCTVTQ